MDTLQIIAFIFELVGFSLAYIEIKKKALADEIEQTIEDITAFKIPEPSFIKLIIWFAVSHIVLGQHMLTDEVVNFVMSFTEGYSSDVIEIAFGIYVISTQFLSVVLLLLASMFGLFIFQLCFLKLKKLGNKRAIGGMGLILAGVGVFIDAIQTVAIII